MTLKIERKKLELEVLKVFFVMNVLNKQISMEF